MNLSLRSLLAVALLFCSLKGFSTSCGSESFTNEGTSSSSYTNFTFTGDNGGTWTCVNARTDQTITGRALCFAKSSTLGYVQSNTVSGGCGSLSFSWVQAFSTAVNFQVYVNSTLVGTVNSGASGTFSAPSVNISGNVYIKIIQTNSSSGQLSVDNISWTCYSACAYTIPVVSAASPSGTTGTAFSYTISATQTPTSYAVSSGTLPPGLTLNTSTGVISGTPTAASTAVVGVTATNCAGTSTAANLSFNIACNTPVITSSTQSGTVGTAFSYSLVATNSPTSYAISSGTLPTGLSLNTSTGAITGTPTASASGTVVAFTATNTYSCTSTPTNITFNIAAAPLITLGSLTAFGSQCISSTYGPNSFTITGSTLTSANVTVGPLTGFTFSTSSGGSYTSSLTLTPSGGTLSGTPTIYVKFSPVAVAAYGGTGTSGIPASGGGTSSTVYTNCTGSGVNTTASVTTGASSSITNTTVTLAGSVTANGCSTPTDFGIKYSTTNGFTPSSSGTAVSYTGGTAASYTVGLTGLIAGTTYYYVAYATNSGGTSYGTQSSFTTNSSVVISSANPSVAAGNFTQNTTNNVLYKLILTSTGANSTLTGLGCTTFGNYASADVTNLKVYYSTSTPFVVGSSTLLSTLTTPGVAGAKTFSSFTSQAIPSGTSYIYITADIPCAATFGDSVSINALTTGNLTFTSATTSGSTSAGGTQKVGYATPVNVTSPAASTAAGSSTITWTNPTGCYNEVMIVAAPATNTGTPTGDGSAYTASLTYGSGTGLGNGFVVYKGSTSSQAVTNLTNGNTYYFKLFTRNGTNWSAGTEVSATPTLTYCTAGSTNSGFEYIANVLLSSINNTSTNSTYTNYTASPTGTQTTNLTAGNSYPITVSLDASNSYSGDSCFVWIDWNQSGVFDDVANKAVRLTTASTSAPYIFTGTVAVPSGATLGVTRMRVRMEDDGGSPSNKTPCGTSHYGEVEDYKITVLAGCTPPANPTSTITVTPACGSSSLSYAPTPPTNVTYYWQTTSTGTSTSNPTSSNYTLNSAGTIYVNAYNSSTTCWSSGSINTGALTITANPSITTQPSNVSVNTSGSTTFSIVASGNPTYQWQYNDNTNGWQNVSNGGYYSNATTATLNITNPVLGMSGYLYRCIANAASPCSTNATSSSATLTVTNQCGLETFTNDGLSGTSYTSTYYTGDNSVGWTLTTCNNANTLSGSRAPTIRNVTGSGIVSDSVAGGCSGVSFDWYQPNSTSPNATVYVNGTAIGTLTSLAGRGTFSASGFNISGKVVISIVQNSGGGQLTVDNLAWSCAIPCTSPDSIAFVTQPSNVVQDATMSSVTVKSFCKTTGSTATSFTGNITITASNGGCGYVSQTVAAVNGIATFSGIVFTRSTQTGIKLTASGSGFTSIQSSTFNVTAPGGTPGTTTLKNENFDGGTPYWSFTTATTLNQGSGSNVVDSVSFGTSFNKSLVKSYTQDYNNSQGIEATSVMTFANVTGLGSYNSVNFGFVAGSLGSGTGAGPDNGESMIIETSLDGGSTWNTLLTYYGGGNSLFPMATSPVTSLAYNANASYVLPANSSSQNSAFSVNLPTGTSQFQFRVTAMDNRTEENWAIDNITLTGTTISVGVPKPLPTTLGSTTSSCPSSSKIITVTNSNTQGAVSYAWSPKTNMNDSTLSNPTVNPTSTTIYTAIITDANGCTATAKDTVSMPGGTTGNWTGTTSNDWFYCRNWGNGIVPDNTIDVTLLSSATNIAIIDSQSLFAAVYSGIARTKNITIDSKTLNFAAPSARLVTTGNLTIQNSGLVDMSSGGKLDLSGNWTNNVGSSGFAAGTSIVSLLGSSSAQSITNSSGKESFYDLVTNNTSTGVTLSSNVDVVDVLTLTKGLVTTDSNKMSILSTANAAIAIGTGNTGYGNSWICGNLRRYFAEGSTGAYDFPVGKSNTVRLATLNAHSLSFGGTPYIDAVFNVGAITNGTGLTLTESSTPYSSIHTEGTWRIEPTNQPASGNYDMYLYTSGFNGLVDNQFAVLKRSITSTLASDWTCGNNCGVGNSISANNGSGRRVSDGYALRMGLSSFSDFGLGITGGTALPVELLYLTARSVNNQSIQLNWATATEINNAGFEIYKSADGVAFEKIGFVTGNGSTTQTFEYSFDDLAVVSGTTYYYYLKQVDMDGNKTNTNIVSASLQQKGDDLVVSIYPNPVKDVLNVSLKNASTVSTIDVLDVLGRTIASVEVGKNDTKAMIPIQSLPAGVYLLQVNTENQFRSYKFVKSE